MNFFKLLNFPYFSQKFLEEIAENQERLNQGLTFEIKDKNENVLDFLKKSFYFFDKDEYLTAQLIKYQFFIEGFDRLEIQISKSSRIIFEEKNLSAHILFSGSLKNKLKEFALEYPDDDEITIKIRRIKSSINLPSILDSGEIHHFYIILKDIINSNSSNGLVMSNRSIKDITNNRKSIQENVKMILDFGGLISINSEKTLDKALEDFYKDKNMTPFLYLIGYNFQDFWTINPDRV